MIKINWHSGNAVIIVSNRIKVVRSLEKNKGGQVLYEDYFRKLDLAEILHILKRENKFEKTNLILSDKYFRFFKVTLAKDVQDPEARILEKTSVELSKDGNWSFRLIHENELGKEYLVYSYDSVEYERIKNAFNLANIEIESVKPKLLFDHLQKSDLSRKIPKATLPESDKIDKEGGASESKSLKQAQELEHESEDVTNLSPDDIAVPVVKTNSHAFGEESRTFSPISFLFLDMGKLVSPWMIIILSAILILISVSIYGFLMFRNNFVPGTVGVSEINEVGGSNSVIFETTDTKGETDETKLSDPTFLVLASEENLDSRNKMEMLLLSEGFLNVIAGDLGSSIGRSTTISAKDSIPTDLIDRLTEILDKEYFVEIGDILNEDFSYDFQIIVGDRRPE